MSPPTYQAVYKDAKWNPEQEGEGKYGADNVVSQELPQRVDVQLLNEVPQPLHHILHLLHALALKIGGARRRHMHIDTVSLVQQQQQQWVFVGRLTAPSQKPTVQGLPFRRNKKSPDLSW